MLIKVLLELDVMSDNGEAPLIYSDAEVLN